MAPRGDGRRGHPERRGAPVNGQRTDRDPLDRLDYYTLLGVSRDAEVDEIRSAFRRFARKYHPDRYAGASEDKRARANAIYRRGSEAVSVLAEPAARSAYDAMLAKGTLRLSADARERAIAPKQVVRKRAIPIQSTRAKDLYREAVECARLGDWGGAWGYMKEACDAEPGNAYLEGQLVRLDGKLKAHQRGR